MMNRLQRYVLREILKVLGLAVAGVSLMILLALCVRLLREGLKPMQLQGVILYLVPFTLPFAIPCGMLIATVMSYGRLSGDNELLAIRTSGVNLWTVVWPALLLGLVLTLGCVSLNNDLLPRCQKLVKERSRQLIGPWLSKYKGGAQKIELSSYVVYVGGYDPKMPDKWRWVMVVKSAEGFVAQIMLAETGTCTYDEATRQAVLTLTNGYIITPLGKALAGHGQANYVHFPDDVQYTIDLSEKGASYSSEMKALGFRDLLQRIAKLRAAIKGKEVSAKPRVAERQLAQQISEVNLKIERVNSEEAGLRAQLSQLKTAGAELETNIATGTQRLSGLRDEIALRMRLLQQLDTAIAELREVLATTSPTM